MKQFNIEDLIIENITLTDASIENPENRVIDEHQKNYLQFKLGLENLLNIEDNGIMVRLTTQVKVLTEDSVFTNIQANFTTQFTFHVKEIEEYIKETEKESYDIDQQLFASVLNIVYSTSRGIIYTRCLGTVIGKVILPVISTQKLLDITNQGKITDSPIEE